MMRKTYFSLTILCSTIFSANSQDQNLISYFPFNGNSNDEIIEDRKSQIFGPVLTEDRFGNKNSAYKFNGIDDFIEVFPHANFSKIEDFTISLWAKFHGASIQPEMTKTSNNYDRQYIFSGFADSKTAKDDFFRDGFSIVHDLYVDNTASCAVILCYGDKIDSFKNKPLLHEKWSFLTLRRSKNKMDFFIDGEHISSKRINSHPLNMDHSIYFGTFSGNNPFYMNNKLNYNFNGCIDDIKIYNTSFSNSEVLSSFERESKQIEESAISNKVTVNSQLVDVILWDHQQEDGDTVSVYLNSKLIKERVEVKKKELSFQIELRKGLNTFEVFAHNEGRRPPNTAAILVKDGKSIHRVVLSSKKNEMSVLQIHVKE